MRKGAPMPRSKTLPQPAQKAGVLARLTSSVKFHRSSVNRPWLMEGVAFGGVALSGVLATVGVIGLVGLESPLAKVGSAVLVVGTLLTELAASRLPLHAQKRFGEGAWIKGSLTVLGFGGLTLWNLAAAHAGMQAIDAAALADRRAPLERAAAEADAAREVAEEALREYDAETRRQSESMGSALRGAFESGYVTAAARNARESAEARAEGRVELAQAVTDTRGADRAAERALEAAPQPRPDLHLWLFACVLELIKGCLVWFSSASERRGRLDAKGTSASNSVLQCNTKLAGDPRSMSPAERRELKSRCASLLATIRHMEAAYG